MKNDKYRAGILTVSDKGSQGDREDLSGAAARQMLEGAGFRVECYQVVPDELERIQEALVTWSDRDRLDLVITTGGTGFAPRDLTPEATAAVIEKAVPGVSEAIRQAGLEKTPRAMLSRGISGIRGRTLIVNLPGSERGVRESLAAILEALPHGLEVLSGRGGECGG